MNKIILIGAGGHAKSCIDVIEKTKKYKIIGLIDNKLSVGTSVLGYKVIGNDRELRSLFKKDIKFAHIAIGSIKDSSLRKYLFVKLSEIGFRFPVIISPQALVSKYCYIDAGTIIMNHVIINADAKIGKNCIINNKTLIEHDCYIDDHSHIATSVTINSTVKIGKLSFVGSGSVIKQNITVEDNSFVNMGSIVFKDIKIKLK